MALNRYDEYRMFFSSDGQAPVETLSSDECQEKAKERQEKAKVKAEAFKKGHYAGETYPDLSQIELESEMLYQIFLDSRHDREKLIDSSIIEMLTFTTKILELHYYDYKKENEYKRHKERLVVIENFIKSVPDKSPKSMANRFNWIIGLVTDNFITLWDMICKPSVLRDQLAEINLSRIFWVFYHFSINQMITMVKEGDVLDKIAQILGRPIDMDAFYNALNMPNDVLNVLSVAFFGLRLVADVIMIVKHTCSQEEGDTKVWQRFCSELDKRISNIANSVVWGGINALTNYPEIFGLPAPFIMPLVAGVLTFDLARAHYMLKRNDNRYERTLASLRSKISAEIGGDKLEYFAVLQKMERALVNKQAVEHAVFYFNQVSAFIMFVAFSASLIITPAGAVLACYLIGCMSLGLASCANPDGGEYSNYLMASRNLTYAQGQKGEFNAEQLQKLTDKVTQKFNHLVTVIVERTFVPLAILVIFSVNPIVGLTVTLGYLAYKLNQAYNSADKKKTESPVVLNQFSLFKVAPVNEGIEKEEELATKEALSQSDKGFWDCLKPTYAFG